MNRAREPSVRRKKMMNLQPKRWWFPTALIAAMLLQGIILFTIWSIAAVINADPSDELRPQTFLILAGAIACIGGILFPMGLCSFFVWSSRLLENYSVFFVIVCL